MLILCGIACMIMGLSIESGWLLAAGMACALMAYVGNVLDVEPDPSEKGDRGMLVLSRRQGERVLLRVGEVRIAVEVVVCKGKIRLGFDAPSEVVIMRQELNDSTDPQKKGCDNGSGV